MKYRSNSILAYTPQNRDGQSILKQVLFFKEALDMRVFLIDLIKSTSIFSVNPNSKKNQIRHQGALNRFHDFVKTTLDSDIPNNIILRIGWGRLVSTLIAESERGGYEFVVIDKSGKTESALPSRSDVDRYVSKSHCPVLTINKDRPVERVKTIIIPIDITQQTKKRLYWATFFAKKLNAKVQIVSALKVNIEKTKSLAYKNAERLKHMLEERGIDCEVKILKTQYKENHEVIVQHIEESQAELVIIRTHQEFQFSGRPIGKFVSGIIHGCKVPVFTVGGVTKDYNIDLI